MRNVQILNKDKEKELRLQKRGELFLEDAHYLCQMISNMLLMPLIKKNSVKEKRLHTYILVAQVFINTRKNIVNDILFLPS